MSVRVDMGCEQTRNNTEDPAASHGMCAVSSMREGDGESRETTT